MCTYIHCGSALLRENVPTFFSNNQISCLINTHPNMNFCFTCIFVNVCLLMYDKGRATVTSVAVYLTTSHVCFVFANLCITSSVALSITLMCVKHWIDGLHMSSLITIFDEMCTCVRLPLAERCAQCIHTCSFIIVYHQIWRFLTLCPIHL